MQGQVCGLLFWLFLLAACEGKKDETPVTPPVTSPLSQSFIGFGVINVSYTRVTAEPQEDSSSPGYLRRGTVVKVHERRLIKTDEKSESWVLVEESCKGWLKEDLVDVYDNEPQALTASESIGR